MSMEPIKPDGGEKRTTGMEKINRAQRRVTRSVVNNAAWFIGFFIVFIVVVVFTTDINLSNGLGWAQFGLTFFILLFCTYSMFANFYSSGARAGKSTDLYSEAFKHYDELKKIVIDRKMQGRLTEFCRHYIDDELESARTAILTEVGISYSDYQKEYCGKDKKTLQENEKLSAVQIVAILRANKTKPVKLTPEMILKRGRGSASRSPLGVKPETKRALTFGSKFCTTCITSVLTGVIMLDVIVNPTWATFAACCLKLLPIVLNGFLGYKSGYDNITVATVNYIGDQSDLLQRAIQYIESTPEPVQAEEPKTVLSVAEIPAENTEKTPVQE